MLVTVLSFLAFITVIAYFAISKKQSKLEEYEIPTQSTELKHEIAEVDPVVFEEEPELQFVQAPILEEKPKKAAAKKTATKKPTVKKTKAAKKDGK